MKKGLLGILKGTFLVSGDAPKNWRFLLFVSLLAIFMISSSHQADLKVKRIANLHDEVRALRSDFFSNRKKVQQLKMESTLVAKMTGRGLKVAENPPQKIIIKSSE